ncbi:hypothetical protein MO973_43390 [Paenibacillus sp. TRM 82003]|nr:hypothetical protein [Paenibacillus sp. TRM 82003]
MNDTISSRDGFAMKLLLFIVTLVLFAATAVGYVYGKTSDAGPSASQATPEQTYYKQLTFAANEMHYQLERWRVHPVDEAVLAKDAAYVDSLVGSLREAPEELVVAQAIVEDLYLAYAEAKEDLLGGADGAQTLEAADAHYKRFLENAILIQNFSQYQGLNVICH